MTDVYFEERGSGFAVVLIHGLCETHTIWDRFAANLADKYRIIYPDLPGFGNSPLPTVPFSIDDIAYMINISIDNLGVDKCIMIGHSLGGYVTLAFAANHSSRLSGFGLFHSSSMPDSEEKKHARDKAIAFIDENGVNPFVKSFIPGLYYNKNPSIKNYIDLHVKEAQNCSANSIIAYSRAIKNRPDRQDLIVNSSVPVLFICGDKDKAVPISQSLEQTATLDKSSVWVLKNTAHMGMIEQFDESLAIVRNYLDNVTRNQIP